MDWLEEIFEKKKREDTTGGSSCELTYERDQEL